MRKTNCAKTKRECRQKKTRRRGGHEFCVELRVSRRLSRSSSHEAKVARCWLAGNGVHAPSPKMVLVVTISACAPFDSFTLTSYCTHPEPYPRGQPQKWSCSPTAQPPSVSTIRSESRSLRATTRPSLAAPSPAPSILRARWTRTSDRLPSPDQRPAQQRVQAA